MKKRIAIWTHGGIGSGMYSQGQPCIHNLINRLANQYAIDVYVHSAPNPDFHAERFSLFSANPNVRIGILRWLYLFFLFVINHSKKKYQILYGLWGYPAGFIVTSLGKIFRRPSIIHLQGGDAACVPSLRYGVFYHPFRRKLCMWAYSRCTTLIALTEYQLQSLRALGITRSAQIIPYGVDTNMFSYQPCRNESPSVRFLHVANQTPIKDQGTLLRAFAILVGKIPATLTFVGAEHDNGSIRRLCVDLGINSYVFFHGPQPYEKLPEYYHSSHVLILTSIYEGQGLVFTESAACGTLLAGSCVGILADMGVDCGIITPIKEPEMLSNKILTILKSPARINELKTAARKWAFEKNEDFTVRRILEELNRQIFVA